MSAIPRVPTGFFQPSRFWSRLSLGRQYALASLPVLIVGMLGLGAWVTRSIEEQVIQNTAVSASLFVNSFVAPELQGLASRPTLSEEEVQALDALIARTPLGQRIHSVKVWLPGGRIGYYTRKALMGQVFEPTPELRAAWQGRVAAELSDLADEEDSQEHSLGIPLLEVYMPVRQRASDKIIAVAEFYQDARDLREHLGQTRRRTWLVVAGVTLTMYSLLFIIVHAGGQVIRRQGRELRTRVFELSRLLAQNETLRARVARATRRITELNEQSLRRLSAELHDGPAQALGLALLRLDALGHKARRSNEGGMDDEELERIRETLKDAMSEIRQLCRGMSLPELEGLSVADTIERAVASHRRRTGTEVDFQCEGLDQSEQVTMPIKLTAYRVVQETLMNAFRHAGGRDQRVSARRDGRWLRLTVSDGGDGIPHAPPRPGSEGLGLKGLHERVESLSGRFEVESRPGEGTVVNVRLPLEMGE